MTFSSSAPAGYMRGLWILALVAFLSSVESFTLPGVQQKASQQGSKVPLQMAQGVADNLTKQDITLRMYEVRDHYRKNPEEGVTEVDVCMSLLRTRLTNLELNRCFVGPSTIAEAGNGLFASRDIAEGELITLYPGDVVLLQDSTATTSSDDDAAAAAGASIASAPVGVMFGNHVLAGDRDTGRVTSQEARSYEMEINKFTSIVADPLIEGTNGAYLGHFTNDGASLMAPFDDASRKVYAEATKASANAAHLVVEGAHMATVATTAISKGDEVFVTYGAGYWLCRSYDPDSTAPGVVVEIKGANLGGSSSAKSTESRKDRRKNKKKKKDSPKSDEKKRGFGV